jgi:predicted enzyme related to lactoylglutathione lyase
MNRVVHFELLSHDPQRTAAFYADVFGWLKVRGDGDYWRLISGGEGKGEGNSDGHGENGGSRGRGINGATVRPMNAALPAQTVNTVQVDDLEVYAEKVLAHGGRTMSEVIPLPGVGRFQYCADPHGIPFGIIEYDQ